MEYIVARYGRMGAAFHYQLITDSRESSGLGPIGLLDVEKLRLRRKPVGKNEHLSGGCRGGTRQVKGQQKQANTLHLSACSDRTSGAPALMPS